MKTAESIIKYLADCGCTKQHAGPFAFGRWDGHINPQFSRDLQRIFIRQANRVIDQLDEGILPLKTVKANADNLAELILEAAEFVVWAREVARVAHPHLERVVLVSGRQALSELSGIITGISFDLANTRVTDFLDDETRIIGKAATDQHRDHIRKSLIDGINEGGSVKQISKRIREGTEVFAPWKGDQIARTETAFGFMEGTIEGWQQSGVVTGKQYVVSPEPCPICAAVAELYGTGRDGAESRTFELREPLFRHGSELAYQGALADGTPVTRFHKFSYEGYAERGLQAPPIHPNCRCDIRPIIDERFGF